VTYRKLLAALSFVACSACPHSETKAPAVATEAPAQTEPSGAIAPPQPDARPALPPGSTAPLDCLDAATWQRSRETLERGGLSPDDRARVERVASQLMPLAQVNGLNWPPQVEIIAAEEPNAFAVCYQVPGQALPQPGIFVANSLLTEVIQGKDARLAAILGHEIGHLALHHHSVNAEMANRYRASFYQRGAESDADVYGVTLGLKAGYAFQDLLGGMRRMYDLFPSPPAACTQCDHPTPSERMANLDRNKAQLWRAVSAFDSGVFFAAAGSYEEAARLFAQVVVQFPESWEAQANLGHALLMHYADALGPEDIVKLRVGHLAMGAFYRQPGSMMKQLQMRPHLREQAVEALKAALKLNPNDPIAIANLGIAHLVDPAGTDAEQASWLLEEALKKSQGRNASEVASIAINLAVAYDAAGKKDRAREALGQAIQITGGDPRRVDTPAIQYNAGMSFAASKDPEERANALELLEEYLKEIAGASAWWDLAYDKYAVLAREQGKEAMSREALLQGATPRQVLAVQWPDGKHVALADPLDRVQTELGKRVSIPIVPGQSSLVRLAYPERGSEVIGSDVVLAIALKGPQAPSVQVRGRGLGAQVTGTLKPGMSVADLRKLLGTEADHSRIFGATRAYAIYPAVNLAASFERDLVTEIILVRSNSE
jgi:tetratricopeptide (TPR) repeat protein